MKLDKIRIINCFGFRDTGEIDLGDPRSFIYLLGRNSSGKSSLLNAIKYFDWGITPSQQANFRNFNDSGKQRALVARFLSGGGPLSELGFVEALDSKLTELRITPAAINQSEKLATLRDEIITTYAELMSLINNIGRVAVWKLEDGHYYFLEDGNDNHKIRQERVTAAIQIASQSNNNIFVIHGSPTSLDISFNDFEDLLFKQFPNIYLFNEKYSLRESLPERIPLGWENRSNAFEATFVNYLGSDEVSRFLASNDPDEREELLLTLQQRMTELTNKVNQSQASNTDLLEIRLHEKNGIQITVKTDGKKSYYSHLSDNTKFLFAYYLYQQSNQISGDILLFDEPSNGFHPTAQEFILNFLKRLAAEGNLVVVATHSEHLIDLDLMSGIRLMSVDDGKNMIVRNHIYNQTKSGGDLLALQPILNAIGFRYASQITLKDRVSVTEGVTDLLYIRTFNRVLGYPASLDIAPARGDGTILNIIPLLISQGINFKIVIDTGNVTQKIRDNFGIDDKFIYEIPIPPAFLGKMGGSGIEDLITKPDFANLLAAVGHTVSSQYQHISNSQYMKGVEGEETCGPVFIRKDTRLCRG